MTRPLVARAFGQLSRTFARRVRENRGRRAGERKAERRKTKNGRMCRKNGEDICRDLCDRAREVREDARACLRRIDQRARPRARSHFRPSLRRGTSGRPPKKSQTLIAPPHHHPPTHRPPLVRRARIYTYKRTYTTHTRTRARTRSARNKNARRFECASGVRAAPAFGS